MESKKPRLSDVAKKNTTDRASKLAGAFLPAPPAPATSPPDETTPPDSLTEVIQKGEADFAEGRGTTYSVDELKAQLDPGPASKPSPAEKPKERTRRNSSSTNLTETINQPVPKGLRCTRMIMMTDEHHDFLRELSFRFKMPMTALLYNLLEPAHQTFQREQKKGDQSNV